METSIEELNLLSQEGGNWYSVAKVATGTITKNNWKSGQAAWREWMSNVSKLTGLNLSTIGRMMSVYEFINQFASSQEIKMNPDRYPFSSLEVLKRINGIAPTSTSALLRSINNREISMRDLRKKLETLQMEQPKQDKNNRSAFNRGRQEFYKYALSSICNSLSEFNCPAHYTFVEFNTKLLGFRREVIRAQATDAIAFDPKSIKESITGFEIVYFGNKEDDLRMNWYRLIYRCCFMSSFFNKLYVVLPSTTDHEVAENIANTIAITGRNNVGVALLNQDPINIGNSTYFEFLSRPLIDAPPIPDCRSIAGWEWKGSNEAI